MTVNPPRTGSWLIPYVSRPGSAYRLLCLPHAGGSASYYPWLRDALTPGGELFCVQYPGRQERRHEPAVEKFPAMVEAVVEVLAEGPEIPVVLYGHSMGSLIAFEVARALPDRVAALIVSGRRAPSVRPPGDHEPPPDNASMLAMMRDLGGIDRALLDDPDVVEMALPSMVADFRLAATYVPEPGATVAMAMTVLNGDADPLVTAPESQAWRTHAAGPCTVHQVTGGHFFFHDDRAAVVDLIRSAMPRPEN